MSILASDVYVEELTSAPISYDTLAGRDIFTVPPSIEFEPWHIDEALPAPMSDLLSLLTPTALFPIVEGGSDGQGE